MIIKETDVIKDEANYKVKIFFDDISIVDLFLDSKYEAINEQKYFNYQSVYYIFINYTSLPQKHMIEECYFKNDSNLCLCDNFIYYLVDIEKAKVIYQKKNYSNYLIHEIKMIEFISYFITDKDKVLIDYLRKNKAFNIFQREKLISDILKIRG